MGIILSAVATVALAVAAALVTGWLEPKLVRSGGEAGPAAPVMLREDLYPQRTDPWLYVAAPVVALLGLCWAMVVIPLGPRWIGQDLTIGLFYFIVAVDFVVLAIALGGWGANSPGGVEACYRAVAQLIAYVIPLGLAIIGPIMMARSLSTIRIVEAQQESGLWYIVAQPLGFALYVATALMQSYRAPFLEPFAARLQHGVLGVYGGWKAALWRISLSGLLFVVAAMGAVLFLGGYAGPWLPGWSWMLLKSFGLMAFMVWIGQRFALRSTSQMLAFAWKILIPVGLANVLIVGGLILLGVGQSPFK